MGGAETLVSNAQNAFGLQKPNVGFGSGVMPTPEMAGQNFGLATPSDLFRQQESIMAPSMPNVITQTGTELTGENIGKTYGVNELEELQKNYKILEEQRKAKLNKLMELSNIGNDRQAASPRPQMVGSGGGMRNFQPISAGPVKKQQGILNEPFLKGFY